MLDTQFKAKNDKNRGDEVRQAGENTHLNLGAERHCGHFVMLEEVALLLLVYELVVVCFLDLIFFVGMNVEATHAISAKIEH